MFKTAATVIATAFAIKVQEEPVTYDLLTPLITVAHPEGPSTMTEEDIGGIAERSIAMLDANGSGEIDSAEFEAYYRDYITESGSTEPWDQAAYDEAFAAIDTSGNGAWSKGELDAALTEIQQVYSSLHGDFEA